MIFYNSCASATFHLVFNQIAPRPLPLIHYQRSQSLNMLEGKYFEQRLFKGFSKVQKIQALMLDIKHPKKETVISISDLETQQSTNTDRAKLFQNVMTIYQAVPQVDKNLSNYSHQDSHSTSASISNIKIQKKYFQESWQYLSSLFKSWRGPLSSMVYRDYQSYLTGLQSIRVSFFLLICSPPRIIAISQREIFITYKGDWRGSAFKIAFKKANTTHLKVLGCPCENANFH